MNKHIIIDRRFCGRPRPVMWLYLRNVGQFYWLPAEVKRIPSPLDIPLMVKQEDHQFILLHREAVVARAAAASVDMEVPDPPTMDQARGAVPEQEIFDRHAFPGCFVCGPQRDAGDGLRIFAGPVAGRSYVAAPWIPDSSVTDSQGIVRDEIICAALDCPGAWAVFAEKLRVIVLGTLAVDIVQRMRAGDPCIVVGWKMGQEGRKLYAGTAIFSATGELYASPADLDRVEIGP